METLRTDLENIASDTGTRDQFLAALLAIINS